MQTFGKMGANGSAIQSVIRMFLLNIFSLFIGTIHPQLDPFIYDMSDMNLFLKKIQTEYLTNVIMHSPRLITKESNGPGDSRRY